MRGVKVTNRINWSRLREKLSLLLAAVAIAGCAGASVSPGSNTIPVSSGRPSIIYVYPFAVNVQDVTLNQGFFQKTYRDMSDSNADQSQFDLGHETASALADQMVQQLESLGFNASRVPRGTQVSGQNILIVDGSFTNINQGNRLRRMVIGLGSGQSNLNAEVQVYQMANGSTMQIMDFATEANSGSMPGAALTAPAGAAAGGTAAAVSLGLNLAAGAGKTYTSAMSVMAQRSANQAVAYMSQYFASQNWIPQSLVQNTDGVLSGGLPSF
jgi:Domain of unknown function (DUF4410)